MLTCLTDYFQMTNFKLELHIYDSFSTLLKYVEKQKSGILLHVSQPNSQAGYC